MEAAEASVEASIVSLTLSKDVRVASMEVVAIPIGVTVMNASAVASTGDPVTYDPSPGTSVHVFTGVSTESCGKCPWKREREYLPCKLVLEFPRKLSR